MKRLISWLRGVWLGGRATEPQPSRRYIKREPFAQLACAECGRVVAHTKGKVAWPHRCPAVPRVVVHTVPTIESLPIPFDSGDEVAS